MSDYSLACLALFFAAVAQTSALWLTTEAWFAARGQRARRVGWFALAAANALLALHHGHDLELALRTGLFDYRQAVLASLIAACSTVAALAFRRA